MPAVSGTVIKDMDSVLKEINVHSHDASAGSAVASTSAEHLQR